eukprot:TRINITY_DN3388_c0_g1_i2.p1 TRINITY_DN3388_c0_g1~~TRINITY_DN3388_c0_g1_i2.p1  ORF type:complete len:487 (-),score=63.00 TRINITY_DN3388_c0_g1_i2:227-1687(-)
MPKPKKKTSGIKLKAVVANSQTDGKKQLIGKDKNKNLKRKSNESSRNPSSAQNPNKKRKLEQSKKSDQKSSDSNRVFKKDKLKGKFSNKYNVKFSKKNKLMKNFQKQVKDKSTNSKKETDFQNGDTQPRNKQQGESENKANNNYPPKQSRQSRKEFKTNEQQFTRISAKGSQNFRIRELEPNPVNSNWEKMKNQIGINSHRSSKNQYRSDLSNKVDQNLQSGIVENNGQVDIKGGAELTRVVALDCEMVGVGYLGGQSVVARVSVVNDLGGVLYDAYVQPKMKVTDFRTRYSGIRPSNLREAVTFEEMQEKVSNLLKNRILVGHALKNDLQVLQISHPKRLIRDTARYPPFLYRKNSRLRPKSLKNLAKEYLHREIQEGEHSSVEDARTALYIYHKFRDVWEKQIQKGELSGYKFASFAKRRDPVKDAQKNAKKLEKEKLKYYQSKRNQDTSDSEDDLAKSKFSLERMEQMQLRMNDPYSDPMADL